MIFKVGGLEMERERDIGVYGFRERERGQSLEREK